MTIAQINRLIDEGLAAKTPEEQAAWENKMQILMKQAADTEEFEQTSLAFMSVLLELGKEPAKVVGDRFRMAA